MDGKMKNKKQLENENATLKKICVNLAWQARRYCDGRSSYVTSMFNEDMRTLISLGVDLNATGDGTIWARDAMGRNFDGLTDAEAAMGEKPTNIQIVNEEIAHLR
jgi:hypothetical protein